MKPPAGVVKLNVDGSFIPVTGAAGAGMILRDWMGQIIFSSCRVLHRCSSALEAEMSACLEGIKLAMQWSAHQFVVESDSAELVAMVNSPSRDGSALCQLVGEIKHHMASDRCTSLKKIPRAQNHASHLLAKFGREENRTVVWLGAGPESIQDLILSDCNITFT